MHFTWNFGLCLVIWCSATARINALHPINPETQVVRVESDLFPLSIIHINDFHARFEETNEQTTSCSPGQKCIGGYARAVTMVKKLQQTRPNPIYLNAGDNFQGTIWYNIGRWNVTSQLLNMLNADAMVSSK